MVTNMQSKFDNTNSFNIMYCTINFMDQKAQSSDFKAKFPKF